MSKLSWPAQTGPFYEAVLTGMADEEDMKEIKQVMADFHAQRSID